MEFIAQQLIARKIFIPPNNPNDIDQEGSYQSWHECEGKSFLTVPRQHNGLILYKFKTCSDNIDIIN